MDAILMTSPAYRTIEY